MLSLQIIYSIVILFNIKGLILLKGKRAALIGSLISTTLVVGFVGVTARGKLTKWNFAVSTYEIFDRFDTIICLIFNLICSVIISCLANQVARPRLLPSLYEKFAYFNFEGTQWRKISNDDILKREVKNKIRFGTIIRKVFTSSSTIDPIIQECKQ